MKHRAALSIGFLAFVACGDDAPSRPDAAVDAAPVPTLAIAFERGATSEIVARITVSSDATPDVTVAGGVAGPLTAVGSGAFTLAIRPPAGHHSAAVAVTAKLADVTATRDALIFEAIDAAWGVPEPVPGLVNNGGWEDSAEVSPDGEWLVVSSYTPIDLFCCTAALPNVCPAGAFGAAYAACNTSLGAYAAPERPALGGAARIVSPTKIMHVAPRLGITTEIPDLAIPPLSSYGFRRQPDGSYAQAFSFTFETDGAFAPFGVNFVHAPASDRAEVIFGYGDPRSFNTGVSPSSDVYWLGDLQLGASSILGTYAITGGEITATGFTPTKLAVPESPVVEQGNPMFDGTRLWFDNDTAAAGVDKAVFFSTLTGVLPTGTWSTPVKAGFAQAGVGEFQPFMDGTRLYFAREFAEVATVDLVGTDPARADAWSASTTVVRPGGAMDNVGDIVTIGEPSVARIAGETWLYFVYVVRTPTGLDANVGRIRRE
ncbi:MAG TPA: hypothetical protein VFQ53_16130 [Kofleriaceae bacterium]|nr:hypothetical protein [Kofleriaceae bacterium]